MSQSVEKLIRSVNPSHHMSWDRPRANLGTPAMNMNPLATGQRNASCAKSFIESVEGVSTAELPLHLSEQPTPSTPQTGCEMSLDKLEPTQNLSTYSWDQATHMKNWHESDRDAFGHAENNQKTKRVWADVNFEPQFTSALLRASSRSAMSPSSLRCGQ